MKTAVFDGPRLIRIQETPLPRYGSRDVLVRLEGCGVCASNLPLWEGRPWFSYPAEPGAPGHEAWGIIETIGVEVKDFEPGDRVTFISSRAFAQYDVARDDTLVKLPASLCGKPFPGEPLGCAINIFNRCDIRAGDTVAIIGIGFLGALLTSMAVRADARVIAISRRTASLKEAAARGATAVLPLTEGWKVVESVRSLTSGEGCDRVIEAAGMQETLDLAAECTRVRGRMIIAGYHQDGKRQVDMQTWNWRGIDCINAHERDPAIYTKGIRIAVGAVESRVMEPFSLFTHRFSLGEINDAFCLLRKRPDNFFKALVVYE